MNFNKLILAGFTLVFASSLAFSVGFDYNLGGGFGFYQTSSLSSGSINKEFPTNGATDIIINKFSNNNYSWTGGGFIGLGVSFEAGLPMAIGFEYKGEYLNTKRTLDYSILDASDRSVIAAGKEVASLSAYKHSADLYYKLTLLEGGFPIGIQFMAGLAMMNPLSYSTYTKEQGNPNISISRYNYLIPTIGLGAHLGIRAHFHMLYLGVDYSNIAYLSQGGSAMSLQDSNMFSRNTVNFSVGLTLNSSVLEAMKG